jgi:hypothetical protein
MSTKIGVIAEGPIDHALLYPLLERIARDRVGFNWPVRPDDVADHFPLRKRGHGGVVDAVRRLVQSLDQPEFDHAFFVVLLDRRTRAAQLEIRKILSKHPRFVFGVAIEEIEAWWLADRVNTLLWSELSDRLPSGCLYAAKGYRAERDKCPKKTLDELTRHSDRFDRVYGEGSVELAREFAHDYWRQFARLDDIARECPRGYRKFEKAIINHFKAQLQIQSGQSGRAADQ